MVSIVDESNPQNDLAKHLAAFHVLVGGPNFLQREHFVHPWLDTSGRHMVQNFVQLTPSSKIRTEQTKLPRIHEAQVNADVGAGGCAAGYQRPSRFKRF